MSHLIAILLVIVAAATIGIVVGVAAFYVEILYARVKQQKAIFAAQEDADWSGR